MICYTFNLCFLLCLLSTHTLFLSLSVRLSLSNKGLQRDSLSLIIPLKFLFTFSCSSFKPSTLICTIIIPKDLIIYTMQNTNGLKSTISTHCHVTLIYSVSVGARCAANIHLTKSHRLALIPACQLVSRDQLLFLFDFRGLCSCAAGDSRVWITISIAGMCMRWLFASIWLCYIYNPGSCLQHYIIETCWK